MYNQAEMSCGGVRGLRLPPQSVRARLIAAGPRDALATRYDPFSPIELILSDIGDDYLAGRVKVVGNYIRNMPTAHSSFSIVTTPDRERASQAEKNRDAVHKNLCRAYFLTVAGEVARLAGKNRKSAKRMRAKANKALADYTPDVVDAYFAQWPAAIQGGADIRQLIERVRL